MIEQMNLIINKIKFIKNILFSNYIKEYEDNELEKYEDDELEKYLESKFMNYKIICGKNEKFSFNQYQFNFKNEFLKEEILLYHRTDESSTIGIIDTNSIYGIDVNKAAHFELEWWYGNNAPAKNGVTLIFKWNGKQELTYADADDSNTLPNILYHVSAFSSKLNLEHPSYWESRIYPNTNSGLELIGIKRNEYEIIIFNNPIRIRVTEKKNLLN